VKKVVLLGLLTAAPRMTAEILGTNLRTTEIKAYILGKKLTAIRVLSVFALYQYLIFFWSI